MDKIKDAKSIHSILSSHSTKYICVGKIIAVHGIKGAVVVQTYTEKKMSVLEYGTLWIGKPNNPHDLRPLNATLHHVHKKGLVLSLEDINDRTEAETLIHTFVWIERGSLPHNQEEDSWYYVDLIGIIIYNSDKVALGKIINIVDFGAGNLLEIQPNDAHSSTFFIPFRKTFIPEINIQEGYMIVDKKFSDQNLN